MRRKFAQPVLPTLYFRDGILSVPGYTFEKASPFSHHSEATPWEDTGSMTMLAEGTSLKDGSSVLAKIVPAHSNASMLLEREAHILERMSTSPESSSTTLRMVEFFSIPRINGDCVVLLVAHPGLNLLGRYFPPHKVNDLLLGDISRVRPPPSHTDILMMGMEEPYAVEEMEAIEIMDLASFLEFAIQATHCLEMMHRSGLIHREVRANAFHLNAYSGLVRIVHFGNRAVSLEQFGVPSTFVLRADAFEEAKKLKVKEALCYLAPEQTGSMEALNEDHRTDLYSLGIMFWTLLVGRGTLPFEGGPLELLHAIVQKRPMPVHEVRRDVPQVLAFIIDKLLSKNPDQRYQSAYGLKADLLQCQRLLLRAVTVVSDQSPELIPYFDIATDDRYMEFTIPSPLFGREKELETIRNIIRHTSTSYSRHIGVSHGSFIISSSDSGTNTGTTEDPSDSRSSKSEGSAHSPLNASDSHSPKLSSTRPSDPSVTTVSVSVSTGAGPSGSDGLRRVALAPSSSRARTHAVIVTGPPGAGKSSLIMAQQARWRSHGLWGQAKFSDVEAAPFSSLLACLSSVLRQLIVFHTDVHNFVTALKRHLGPQLHNVPLLYEGAPELRDILKLFDITIEAPQEVLETHELRARFQSLVQSVFSVLAETRLFALFLDDLHDANDSSLDLINALVNSRTRILVFATVRSDKPAILDRMRATFSSKSTTWIHLEPLNYTAISSMVARTLHRPKEDCSSLSRLIHAASMGNAFSARNILMTLQRQHHITFNWERNCWEYDIAAIEPSLHDKKMITDPSDLSYLINHFHELPEDARKYLIWASFFGPTFKVAEVALLMDWEDSSGTSGSSGSDEEAEDMWNVSKAVKAVSTISDNAQGSSSRGSMRGLQTSIAEGWLVQRARDMCSFAHDRYRQAALAEAESLPQETISKMSFKIILMMLHEATPDVYRIAEHAKRCLPLLREHAKRDDLLKLSIDAGDSARARGAHELALQSYINAQSLLDATSWAKDIDHACLIYLKLAELYSWKGEYATSDELVTQCLEHLDDPESRVRMLRLRSKNQWMRGNYKAALADTLLGLHILGVDINSTPSQREADSMFEQVKNEILAVGFDNILSIPRARDTRTDLAIALLNDAGHNAYWSSGERFPDVVGLTTIRLALRFGMCSGAALGFFWALGGAAERRELYRFSTDLGKLALRIADQHGTSYEKCRALVLFSSMVAGFDTVHIRANLARLEEAIKYGQSAGDRIYTSLSSVHLLQTRLWICDHVSELVVAGEECLSDVSQWAPGGDIAILAQGILNCIRAIGGYTYAYDADTVFDTEGFDEKQFLEVAAQTSGNFEGAMGWYVVALFCLGFPREAAILGFSIYQTRGNHPNHRHTRYALFFHTLAMIQCIRKGDIGLEDRKRYMRQIELNQAYVRKWLSPSPVNTSAWVALVDAELASLVNSPDAFKLYDVAVKLAVNNDWLLESGWAMFLQGSHFVRCGVEGLGSELQRRGIARQAQWGARGIVNYLSSLLDNRAHYALKHHIFSADVAVQTDNIVMSTSPQSPGSFDRKMEHSEEDEISTLSASDLASILKWSKEISSDINLPMALQRLTEIATETSGSQYTCVVIAREAGDYTVATSMIPPEPCQVHENPLPIRSINDPLRRAIIQHALNSKERIYYEDVSIEPRFSSEAQQSTSRSVICLPIFSNRGQTFGAVYLASKYAFSPNTVTILTLLCQQASIGISNALLFRSVQAGTRENLKMIAAQRDALEAARKSREDALKATKIKSNFLASMSHELRTPFSSFYGLLDILSGTELNPAQREIVQTAKQSCELLLKIIDSILDYSKLEASALKLEYSGFSMEDMIADCMELLLPMAAKKLDLSYNIEPDVPSWVRADYARIRQVLMNLIGNAVKFTARGSVRVLCTVDRSTPAPLGEPVLKFFITDTGIGMSASDIDLLFVPFQQADNSSTRRFGGTGLGLSISRQLVKLMGGAIGVKSELGVGSTFWFTLPVKVYDSEESRQAMVEITHLRQLLLKPRPLRILVSSASDATQALLSTMLNGFSISTVSSTEEAETVLRNITEADLPLDFVILDDQSEARVDEFSRVLRSLPYSAMEDTKIIHLFTPTTDNLSGTPMLRGDVNDGILRVTKPPRQARLLQTLASLKNLPAHMSNTPILSASALREEEALARRTLYGNVLIAEDNPVAQKLLVAQLQRYQLNVVATSNGEEAIAEWEKHEPGYFSVALFDHHMPICDGVEACKRVRIIENKRRVPVSLPIVALSADCQESTKQLCLSAGMNEFLSKPLKKGDLLTLLSTFGEPLPGPKSDNTSASS
ncbi:histidine kinase [Laetiporus sulphureus 93-53]|uniref:histidine kinase n=1 Tax=Laetiporus sulphureus 93-53 TaxID=1314785 RepID=A0A165E4E0_9APHY|nr:histidine kinase [Laetiporus sulphureus 93-53]KZT06226.1 histidine kinase [Laetiporus sulphureus 93-53]